MARKPRRRDDDGDIPVSQSTWRNRIVEHANVAPAQLMAHPLNPRLHGRGQQQAMTAVLDDLGVIQSVIVSKRTGTIIDGHMRVNLALRSNQPTIPVCYVDLSAEEEAKALATFDPVGDLAGLDAQNLEMLLGEFNVSGSVLNQMLGELASSVGLNLDGEEDGAELDDAADQLPGLLQLPEGKVFDSHLRFDIPPLIEDRLAEIPPNLKVWARGVSVDDGAGHFLHIWGGDSTKGLPFDRTLLGFYTDDVRFESFYREPHKQVAKLLNTGIPAAITPNYSMWGNQPRAVHLFSTYKSRYVGRYMQEAGISVIPDVAWSDMRSFEFNLIGIPPEPPAVAIQLQTQDLAKSAIARQTKKDGIAEIMKQLRPKSLLVYGGPAARELMGEIDPGVPVTMVANWAEVSRARKGG